MYKYRTDYPDKIEKFEVIKETPSRMVFINIYGKEQREAKSSEYHIWADTFSEAQQKLIDRHQEKIDWYKRQIEWYEGYIKTIRGLNEC